MGQVMGALAMVATRRSVIFSSEGFEFVLTCWGTASSVPSVKTAAPAAPASPFRNPRLPGAFARDLMFIVPLDWAGPVLLRGRLYCKAQESVPRELTSSIVLDYHGTKSTSPAYPDLR